VSVTAVTTRRLRTPTSPDHAGHRADIQGLRALALVLVLLFHAGVTWVPGGYVGVDVFFVISGYVVTARLRDEVAAGRPVSLTAFMSRRARRLLPAAAVAIAATGLLTVAFLPATRWASIAGDMVASGAFWMNLHLASRSVDYLASGAAESPLQHFWSLGVEAQFYLAWGALVWLGALCVRRSSSAERRHALVGVALLVAVVGSVVLGVRAWRDGDPTQYFSPVVRFWEIGLGGLLAWRAGRGSGSTGRVPAAAAGVTGLIAIVLAAALFTAETTFPGVAALLPTAGAALILWAGEHNGSPVPRLLGVRPVAWVGDISYSYYLWHWPLLVVAAALWAPPGTTLSPAVGIVVVLVAALPAWASRRWVERLPAPDRFGARTWTGVLVVASLVLCGGSAALVRASVPSVDSQPAGAGAEALGRDPVWAAAGEPVDAVSGVVELAAAAVGDVADVYGDGCHQDQVAESPLSCTYGDAESPVTVALVGDSHAAQWQPTLRAIAEEQGWHLVTFTKSACPWARSDVWLAEASSPYPSCAGWVENVTAELRLLDPTVVVTSSGPYAREVDGREDVEGGPAALAAGLAAAWDAVGDRTQVIALADTPYIGIPVPECLASEPHSATSCAADRAEARARSAAEPIEAVASRTGVALVDLTDYVCPRTTCAPVIGGVVVYRDEHHLTATYARSLASALLPALHHVAPGLR
jgi:peptidoglycan/LPS O-acetylase OafA/YrhL